MSDTPDHEATTHADLYQRHGDSDPSKWEQAEAVTGRPNDTPLRGEDSPAVPNTTLADRAKARLAQEKQVKAAENKAVDGDETKASPKKQQRKRS